MNDLLYSTTLVRVRHAIDITYLTYVRYDAAFDQVRTYKKVLPNILARGLKYEIAASLMSINAY